MDELFQVTSSAKGNQIIDEMQFNCIWMKQLTLHAQNLMIIKQKEKKENI